MTVSSGGVSYVVLGQVRRKRQTAQFWFASGVDGDRKDPVPSLPILVEVSKIKLVTV